MRLKYLKKNMLLPKKEIFINKTIHIGSIDIHVIALTLENDKNALWVMYQSSTTLDEEYDLDEEIEFTTNREEMLNDIRKDSISKNIFISEMMIQNQKITFSSSSSSPMHDTNYEGYMKLQHFIENGMDTTNLNEIYIDDLVIKSYEQKEGEEFPDVDLSKELDITLKIDASFKQIPINTLLRLPRGKMEKGYKFHFYDSIQNKRRIFYINEIKQYDIWEEINNFHKDERVKDWSKEQIEEFKKGYMEHLDDICPRGMNLALIEYETEDDIQLNFYSKEYLDQGSVHNNNGSSGIIFFKSDQEFGINGFKSRVSMLKPVEKDFHDFLDVELFSWYMKIPEEIIRM